MPEIVVITREIGYNGRNAAALATSSRPLADADGGRSDMPNFKPIPEKLLRYPDEFWKHVGIDMYDTDACFPWNGIRVRGYGVYHNCRAHRVAYTLTHGPIPEGMTIDHLCRHTWCCNTAHMEPVPSVVNHRRWVETLTHCARGHEFTPENTYTAPSGRRVCRRCRNANRMVRRREGRNA